MKVEEGDETRDLEPGSDVRHRQPLRVPGRAALSLRGVIGRDEPRLAC